MKMTDPLRKILSLLSMVMLADILICALSSAAQSTGGAVSQRELEHTMTTIRTGGTSTIRTDAAKYLAELTLKFDPEKIDGRTLAELVSLLNTSEDSVRFWAAAALGNLGPRAKIAVPTLVKLLPEVDCLPGELTSAPAIRLALERIGEKPPPPPNCEVKREQSRRIIFP